MKKIKKIAALGMIVFVMTIPTMILNAQGNNYLCLFGRDGEDGTWMEGACIEEEDVFECFTCIALE